MDSPFSKNYATQRRQPRPSKTSSSKGNASAGDPFPDGSAQSSQPATDPFASPQRLPRSESALSQSTTPGDSVVRPARVRYFHSRRVRKDEVIKPWVKEPRDPAEKWIEVIPLIGLLIGMGIAGVLIWDGLRNVVDHKYCHVWVEDWSEGLNTDIWHPETQHGGFG